MSSNSLPIRLLGKTFSKSQKKLCFNKNKTHKMFSTVPNLDKKFYVNIKDDPEVITPKHEIHSKSSQISDSSSNSKYIIRNVNYKNLTLSNNGNILNFNIFEKKSKIRYFIKIFCNVSYSFKLFF